MEIGWICAVVALALAAAILLLKWALLRASLREVSRELAEKLRTDTNTLISLSSGDRAVRALAAQMNIQLQALRRERLRLQKGDAELKNAITNVSHDLRTDCCKIRCLVRSAPASAVSPSPRSPPCWRKACTEGSECRPPPWSEAL